MRKFPQHPLVGVGVVVFDKNGVLLVKRGEQPLKGNWTIPGGVVEVGETLKDAAMREILEECGIHVKNLKFVDVVELIDRQGDRTKYHYVIIDFVALEYRGSPKPGSDVVDLSFVPIEKLPDYSVLEYTQRVIKRQRRS